VFVQSLLLSQYLLLYCPHTIIQVLTSYIPTYRTIIVILEAIHYELKVELDEKVY